MCLFVGTCTLLQLPVETLDSLELDLQVLGTEFRVSVRAASTPGAEPSLQLSMWVLHESLEESS